jgi:pantetheine-phosphate adenylyltransferase
MPLSRIAIFPGSFDPLTLGHLDLIERAVRLFDQVIVAVLINPDKRSLFDADERVAMIADACAGVTDGNRIKAEAFEGLLVNFATAKGACAVVRGLRSGLDFDYERPMASMNAHLAPGIDTVFLAATGRYAHISSSLVKDVASHGGSVDGLVPAAIATRLVSRLSSVRGGRS